MNKDILLEEVRKVELAVNLAEQDGGIDCSLADDVWYLIDCINKLIEPEVLSQKMADELHRYKGLGYSLKDLLVIAGSKQEQEKLARAWLDGYEVEKEKKYRVRAGNRYVRFNLDGSIIGVRKENSVVCLERLSKLPFDYQKAIESGIITLEDVTE